MKELLNRNCGYCGRTLENIDEKSFIEHVDKCEKQNLDFNFAKITKEPSSPEGNK